MVRKRSADGALKGGGSGPFAMAPNAVLKSDVPSELIKLRWRALHDVWKGGDEKVVEVDAHEHRITGMRLWRSQSRESGKSRCQDRLASVLEASLLLLLIPLHANHRFDTPAVGWVSFRSIATRYALMIEYS